MASGPPATGRPAVCVPGPGSVGSRPDLRPSTGPPVSTMSPGPGALRHRPASAHLNEAMVLDRAVRTEDGCVPPDRKSVV